MRLRIALVLFALALAACEESAAPGADVRVGEDGAIHADVAPADTRSDAALPDLVRDAAPEAVDAVSPGRDAPPDAPPADVAAPGCAELLLREQTFELLPFAVDTQIHAAAAFDGEGVWLAWNFPNPSGTGDFDVWAGRFGCDGRALVPPFPVGTTDHGNEVDPDLAVGNDHVYIAWQADTGGDPHLFVYYRAFRVDGTPLMPAEEALVLRRGGAVVAADAWMVRVAALPDGFALVAAWADPDAQGFQTVLQRLRPDGAPVESAPGVPEELVAAFSEPGASQTSPAIAAQDDGRVWLAWVRSDTDGNEDAQYTSLPPGATTATPSPPATASEGGSAGASYGTEAAAGGPVYLAYFTGAADTDVYVRDGAAFDAPGAPLRFGAAGRADHTPTVGAAPGGGAVAWFRTRSGIRCDLLVQRFADEGGALTAVGEERLLNPPEAEDEHAAPPVYPPALAYVGDGVWFVVWSEGRNPAFRLKGRFVEL